MATLVQFILDDRNIEELRNKLDELLAKNGMSDAIGLIEPISDIEAQQKAKQWWETTNKDAWHINPDM
jgi:hypothetical protein